MGHFGCGVSDGRFRITAGEGGGSLVAQLVKNTPAMWETWI